MIDKACVDAGPLQCFVVLTVSMEPTLRPSGLVRVDPDAYQSADPAVGEVIALHPPEGAFNFNQSCGVSVAPDRLCPLPTPQSANDVVFVKRVVAGPGDSIAVRGGKVLLDGRRLRESYARTRGCSFGCDFKAPITVAGGYWFVMGDNRGGSEDSREWGPIPKSWIVGKVVSH